jgi:hypothetical protein
MAFEKSPWEATSVGLVSNSQHTSLVLVVVLSPRVDFGWYDTGIYQVFKLV